MNLVCAGSCAALISVQMLTTTTENTGRRIIMPAERKYCQKWCTDFTYLFLENHEVRYNCTIIDLHDRSVVAGITDRHITSDLAIRTLKKALESQPSLKGKLILHSDQGSQFTSKAFVEFCESVHVTQSMSKAGYPYDNAPMEGYFNTLKSELIYLCEYDAEEALYQARIT